MTLREPLASLNTLFYKYLGLNVTAQSQQLSCKYIALLTFINMTSVLQFSVTFACRRDIACEFQFGDHSAYIAEPRELYRVMLLLVHLYPFLNNVFLLKMMLLRPAKVRRACRFITRAIYAANEQFSPFKCRIIHCANQFVTLTVMMFLFFAGFTSVKAHLDGVNITTLDVLWLLKFGVNGLLYAGSSMSFVTILFVSNEYLLFNLVQLKSKINWCVAGSSNFRQAIDKQHELTKQVADANILISGFFNVIMFTFIPFLCLLFGELFNYTNPIVTFYVRVTFISSNIVAVFGLYYASRLCSEYHSLHKLWLKLSTKYRSRSVLEVVKSFTKQKRVGLSIGSYALITKFTFFKITLIIVRLAMKGVAQRNVGAYRSSL